MKQIEAWERPKSSRIYLHPYGSQRLVSVYPDMKITDLELNDKGRHYNLPSFGVHILFGDEPEEADMELTRWKSPEGGIPVYTMYNKDSENGCDVKMTSFCDTDRVPTTYCEMVVTNNGDTSVNGVLGLLPRYSLQDHYLTGLHDTGYEPYNPNVHQWYLCWSNAFSPCQDNLLVASDEAHYSYVEILEHDDCNLVWISRKDQINRFKAYDYYRIEYSLSPKQSFKVRFAMRRGEYSKPKDYSLALKSTVEWWEKLQSKVTKVPDKIEYENMFRQNVTQMMQMFQHYEGNHPDNLHARQGDVGRYLWVWEAAHFTTVLDDIGLAEYVTDACRMWFDCWQINDGDEKGKLDNPYVKWDNTNGAAIWATCSNLLALKNKELFLEFYPKLNLALEFIQNKRKESENYPDAVKGLFPDGVASDWGEVGQHWTYTDAVNAYGIGVMADCYEYFGAEEAEYVRGIWREYTDVLIAIMEKFAAQHKGERAYNMPHILGVEFENSYNHCFYTDGCPYLIKLGIMNPNSEIFSQMENFYRDIGFLDDIHGLAGRMTNDDCGAGGLYGHVYYTGVPEILWIQAWRSRGEHEKANKYFEGMLNYNVTSEYITSERYCSTDPWFTPWQPNASGAGRLCKLLLDTFGEKSTSQAK